MHERRKFEVRVNGRKGRARESLPDTFSFGCAAQVKPAFAYGIF
jgi:hypothetical protein